MLFSRELSAEQRVGHLDSK